MAEQEEQPKLIIDSDWKSQAEAERQKLAEEANRKAEEANDRELPPADVTGIVQILATQALLYMGAFPDPQTGRAVVAMDLAKFHVDLLGTLEEKTKGNLSEDEEKLVSQTAHELRLQFVEVNKAVDQAIADGRAKQVDMGQDPGQPGFQPGGGGLAGS